jgi:hypothetical protein
VAVVEPPDEEGLEIVVEDPHDYLNIFSISRW